MTIVADKIPRAFIWRRLHSLMGLWLVIFLCEHLLTNSQAALWVGDSGTGFIDFVNFLHNLPYLQVIEIVLLGIPFVIHMVWGVKYLLTSKFNSYSKQGKAPYLPLGRNRAYTWQRITSWILLVCIIGHVAKFRFLDYPRDVPMGNKTVYLITVSSDPGLYTVAERLDVSLYDQKRIAQESQIFEHHNLSNQPFTPHVQEMQFKERFLRALEKENPSSEEVVAVAENFGAASILAVRNTFKNPIYIAAYTLFVLAAVFHASNGFWTFLITWGWVLKMAAQRAWVTVSLVLMGTLLFLGLAAIWGTYWINLRY